jgi:hypothetical protein
MWLQVSYIKMQEDSIYKELQSKIHLAIENKIIPEKQYGEIEFNVLRSGQAISIEHWPSSHRGDDEHTVVEIPVGLLDLFIFNTVTGGTGKHL